MMRPVSRSLGRGAGGDGETLARGLSAGVAADSDGPAYRLQRASIHRCSHRPRPRRPLTASPDFWRTTWAVSEKRSSSRAALEQDPLRALVYDNLGLALHHADRLMEAEAAFRKVPELAPETSVTHAYLSLTLLAQGRGDAALVEAMREPEEWARLWALAIVHHALGHGAESDGALGELIDKYSETGAYQVAEVHAARGETEGAFQRLEQAYAQRDGGLTGLKVNPPLRSLHGDPRWGALLKKMALWASHGD